MVKRRREPWHEGVVPPLVSAGPERWLLAFLYADVASLTPGQLLDVQHDAALFAAARVAAGGADDRFPAATLESLQTSVLRSIHRLRDGKSWTVGEHGLRAGTGAATLVQRNGRLHREYLRGRPRETFIARAADVLVDCWPRLHLCEREGCGRIFLRIGKKRFCQPRCQSRVSFARYKERHGGRRRDAGPEYKRQARARRHLQRIATESRTREEKWAQVPGAKRMKARQAPKRTTGR